MYVMNNVTSGERRLSHSELIARASRAASGFAALGVQAGEPIALYLRNDLAFLEASLGASQLGAYCLPVNCNRPLSTVLPGAGRSGSHGFALIR